MALASSFFCSMLPWREIMIRCAWGEPAPCIDSVRYPTAAVPRRPRHRGEGFGLGS